MQQIIETSHSIQTLKNCLKQIGAKRFLLVHSRSFLSMPIRKELDDIGIPYVFYSDFKPNPLYEDVCKGVDVYNSQGCDAIVAIGGGSAIDVAKCIKLFCKLPKDVNYLNQTLEYSPIPLIAIPTTAGTGSESTRFAVIYYQDKKQSVAHASIVPDFAILDAGLLRSLPLYQKKCTLLDALCQAIESWWSVHSTDESKRLSHQAVETIMTNYQSYFQGGNIESAKKIMQASNWAGRAISITQTTAPHAMSYKLTSLYGVPHGHAVAICLPKVWRYMNDNLDKASDCRGVNYLKKTFKDIAQAFNKQTDSIDSSILFFETFLSDIQIDSCKLSDSSQLDILADSVNPTRLGNNPVLLSREVLHDLYTQILA